MPKYTKTAVLSIRVSEADRAAIAALATELGISQSTLITRRVLGKEADALQVQMSRTERRIARLERKLYGIELSDEEIDRMTEEA